MRILRVVVTEVGIERGAVALNRNGWTGSSDIWKIARVTLAISASALAISRSSTSAAALEPLHMAAREGDVSRLATLLAADEDTPEPSRSGSMVMRADANGDAPLHHAAEAGHAAAVLWLLEHGADLLCFKCAHQKFDKKQANVTSIMCSKCENMAPVTQFSAEAVEAWKDLQIGRAHV